MESDFLRQANDIDSNQIPVVAYYRVSTGQQNESGLGLEAQASAVERLCASRSYGIVAAYAGRGVSGSKPLNERAALMAAIADVKQSGAKALVVSRLDRLSREPLVFITVERILARHGARLISASGEGTENDSPGAVLMRRILQAVAEQESALISLRTTAATLHIHHDGLPSGDSQGNCSGLQLRSPGEDANGTRLRIPYGDTDEASSCLQLRNAAEDSNR